MIYYSAIAETSGIILTIFFISSGIIILDANKLSVYRLYLSLNFIFFSITMLLAVIGNYYSVFFFVSSLIVLGISLNILFKFASIKT